ncbi:hypothetical protein ABD91_05785 [Lysinibacillus sphaericus]|uniref:hypothetical protein n=1 Tax=Lysinibacillus sphaericus TaxID=1421 RepID=UPI0019D5B3EB|nr:hypothetical protein [Lysinibacillus sphaericus]MBG9690404.1 hypothetical protein [Lysinibacillus sphaericus]
MGAIFIQQDLGNALCRAVLFLLSKVLSERMSEFQQAVSIADHERRIIELEIEKYVEKMEKNSDKIKGYFLAAAISGVVGIVFIALQNSIFGG